MKDYKVIVGENIKRIRQEKNMTQDALANACGHDSGSARSWVSKIESGVRNTTTEEIGKIAQALGVFPAMLFIDTNSFDDFEKRIFAYSEIMKRG